ncbi:MAG TPA: class I SAM-dependent methyltransferase [Bryobacteraceae bacterium]|nr:class I SAM-dependent methyltransferase [Bryobacteraceae bacterium]
MSERRLDQERLEREAAFHDEWAESADLSKRAVRECFEAPTAMENQFILGRMGPLKGKRVLDIGAGLGESSVYFAMQGADVTMADLSPAMVRTALELGRHYGLTLEGTVSSGETLNVAENSYDFVYIANTIHHVQDRPALFKQINRALKPGGRFFSIDPIEYNPAIQIYRKLATQVRTPDESPLRYADLKLAKRFFQNVGCRTFWLTSLSLFAKYYFVDRVHPNQDRYWKRILLETPETLRWWMPLRVVDSVLTRIPLVRWVAWNIVIWGEKKP